MGVCDGCGGVVDVRVCVYDVCVYDVCVYNVCEVGGEGTERKCVWEK